MSLRSCLLAATYLSALATPALAGEAALIKRLDALQRMLEEQSRQIEAQKSEIGTLKQQLGTPAVSAAPAPPSVPLPAPRPSALETRVATQQAQTEQLSTRLETAQNDARLAKADTPVWSFAGGRPMITSPDGRFSLAIRAIAQYDVAHHMQGTSARQLAPANGPDLSSGANFRRAQLGVQGRLFNDWSYYFNYDFAGAGGTETPGHIQQAWVQYDGFAPLTLRVGAFSPSANLEDNTAPPDTLFLERNAPADLSRNIAGGDGRNAVGVTYAADRIFAALAYTGNKVCRSRNYSAACGTM